MCSCHKFCILNICVNFAELKLLARKYIGVELCCDGGDDNDDAYCTDVC